MGCFDTQKGRKERKHSSGLALGALLTGIRDKRGQQQKAESGVAIRDISEEGGEEVSRGVLGYGVAAIPFPSSAERHNQLNIIIRIRRGGERIK